MSDGFVYFIQEEETGRIKIGFSEKHPKGRLNDFQTGNSNKLILLGYIEGTYQDESNLHQEFSEERIRNENEWFESSPRLVNRIKQLVEVSVEDKKRGIEGLSQKKKVGKYHGPGIYTLPDGSKYVGETHNGRKMGKGTLTFTNGEEYVGEFRNDLMNGQGTLTFPNGSKYVGGWKDGNRDGQGTFSSSNGEGYVGKWKNGEFWNGQGTQTFHGSKYEGEWKEGRWWNVICYGSKGEIYQKYVEGQIKRVMSEGEKMFYWIMSVTWIFAIMWVFFD